MAFHLKCHYHFYYLGQKQATQVNKVTTNGFCAPPSNTQSQIFSVFSFIPLPLPLNPAISSQFSPLCWPMT